MRLPHIECLAAANNITVPDRTAGPRMPLPRPTSLGGTGGAVSGCDRLGGGPPGCPWPRRAYPSQAGNPEQPVRVTARCTDHIVQ